MVYEFAPICKKFADCERRLFFFFLDVSQFVCQLVRNYTVINKSHRPGVDKFCRRVVLRL